MILAFPSIVFSAISRIDLLMDLKLDSVYSAAHFRTAGKVRKVIYGSTGWLSGVTQQRKKYLKKVYFNICVIWTLYVVESM